jgi:hypothetical protein
MTLPEQPGDLVRLYRMAANERTCPKVDERILAVAARHGKQRRQRKHLRRVLIGTAAALTLGVALRAPTALLTKWHARQPTVSAGSAAEYLLQARAPIASDSTVRSQLLNQDFSEMRVESQP